MNQETAIRVGDRVVWDAPQFSGGRFFRGKVTNAKLNGTKRMRGVVERHSYGEKTGQHTFTIRLDDGAIKLVKGRNLYPNLIQHIPDPNSIDRIKATIKASVIVP